MVHKDVLSEFNSSGVRIEKNELTTNETLVKNKRSKKQQSIFEPKVEVLTPRERDLSADSLNNNKKSKWREEREQLRKAIRLGKKIKQLEQNDDNANDTKS